MALLWARQVYYSIANHSLAGVNEEPYLSVRKEFRDVTAVTGSNPRYPLTHGTHVDFNLT